MWGKSGVDGIKIHSMYENLQELTTVLYLFFFDMGSTTGGSCVVCALKTLQRGLIECGDQTSSFSKLLHHIVLNSGHSYCTLPRETPF